MAPGPEGELWASEVAPDVERVRLVEDRCVSMRGRDADRDELALLDRDAFDCCVVDRVLCLLYTSDAADE